MEKMVILILSLVNCLFALGNSILTNSNQVTDYIDNSNYKKDIRKKISLKGASSKNIKKDSFYASKTKSEVEVEFQDISQKHVNKLFYKNIIKERSKLSPKKYKYSVVRSKRDLNENVGVIVDKKHRVNEVYNYTEVKHVFESPFYRGNENDNVRNVGVVVEKGKKVRKIVNIVDVKNTNLKSNLNMGIKIKSHKITGSFKNDVKIQNSRIGIGGN